MKQQEILELSRVIKKLDGQGSNKLKWAIYRTSKKLQAETDNLISFINDMKPKRLVHLQKLQQELLSKCRSEQEQTEAVDKWEFRDELNSEMKKFIESKKYRDFLNIENTEFEPYKIDLTQEDIEGVELNNQSFWILEKISNGLEKVMEGR